MSHTNVQILCENAAHTRRDSWCVECAAPWKGTDDYHRCYDRCIEIVSNLTAAEKRARILHEADDPSAAAAREDQARLERELDTAKTELRAAGRWELRDTLPPSLVTRL